MTKWQFGLYLTYPFKAEVWLEILATIRAPSGLTDPDGHTILKWVAEDGTVMQPGELAELQ